jgi:hypothetical protein
VAQDAILGFGSPNRIRTDSLLVNRANLSYFAALGLQPPVRRSPVGGIRRPRRGKHHGPCGTDGNGRTWAERGRLAIRAEIHRSTPAVAVTAAPQRIRLRWRS